MPRPISLRLVAACALALVLFAAVAVAAIGATTTVTSKKPLVSLRVVGKGGKVLAEERLLTGTTTVKTSPRATCFGADSAGSGKSVTIRGSTALGALAQASKSTAALRPLSITDAFDFGLGICGVGSSKVSGKASWYLKVNHRGATVSGDAVKLKAGDEVLWDLAPSYPYPNELALQTPTEVDSGVPFDVQVVSYDEKGKGKPVAGATIEGASSAVTTGPDGRATVTLNATIPQYEPITATHGKDIPSATVPVYVCTASPCAIPATK